MTARIREFLKNRKDEGPCLVVDRDVIRENYLSFARALPDSRVYYAVKANAEPAIVVRSNNQTISIFVFSIDNDAIVGIRVVRNTDKLTRIDRKLSDSSQFAI